MVERHQANYVNNTVQQLDWQSGLLFIAVKLLLLGVHEAVKSLA